jgi:transcription termination factor Rho
MRQKRAFAAARQLDGGGSLTTVFAMNPAGDLPIEREAASLFRNKGNAAVAFDSLEDDALPNPMHTRTRSEDLLLNRAEREEVDRMRARVAAAADGECRRIVAEWIEGRS